MSTHEPRFSLLQMYRQTQEVKRAEQAKHQAPSEIEPEIAAMSAHPGVRAVTPSQAAYLRPDAPKAAERATAPRAAQPGAAGGRRRHPWNATWHQAVIDRPVLDGAQESYESEHVTPNPFRGKNDPSLLFTRHYQHLAQQSAATSAQRSR